MPGFTPFTNNYRDLSDDNGYQFEFVCDICGSGYRSEFQRSAIGSASSLLGGASQLIGGLWGASSVFIAAGTAFPDALAGAVAAGLAGVPVILTRPDTVPDASLAEVRRLAPAGLVVLGGTGAVSEGVARLIDTP